eukprot:SAG11_NODE_177_length_13334_cov_9.614280_2_plen_71_part_00
MTLKRYPYHFRIIFQYLKNDPKTVGGAVLRILPPADVDFQDFQNRQGLARCQHDSTAEIFSKLKKLDATP